MASASPSTAQSVSARSAPDVFRRGGPVDRYFYFVMALVQAAVVVWGFSHSVGANLIHATPARPLLLWAHGAAFSLWIVVYITQTALVRVRKVKLHRTLGWFALGLAVCMVGLGLTTALVMGRFDTVVLHIPDAALFQIVSLRDMGVFATFVTLAIVWRRKPELHRRLMFLATCELLTAAFGRLDFVFNHHLFYVCVDGLILMGVLRDLLVDHRISVAYRWAVPILVVVDWSVVQVLKQPPAWWVTLSHRLMA